MAMTLYWHDYETFGLDPRRDRPVQFAGLRTDADLKIVDNPLVVYCKPADDYLPQPEACLVTGITPQFAAEKGICEAEFIALIHQQIAMPGTCTLGYNNIRFDDEVTRNILYRNFYDPYAREWKEGNSRWDLIDLVRATRALRPEGIEWPLHENGKPSFRLEQLTAANGIEHAAAHDALADVYATIAFARLLKQAQPKLYQYVFQHRAKNQILSLLKLGSMEPVLHVSGMYSSSQQCIAVVLPLCKHPTNNNGVLVYDLSVDPDEMLALSIEEIHQRIFTLADDLPDDVQRIPIKTIHINKCPFVAPMSALRSQDAVRLKIDIAHCQKYLQKIKQSSGLLEKLSGVFRQKTFADENDPDLMLYSGGFFKDADRNVMDKIRTATAEDLLTLNPHFSDKRLPEMLFRYRARNFPETLNTRELKQWRAYCINRLTNKQAGGSIVFDDYIAGLNELRKSAAVDMQLIDNLESYARDLLRRLH